MTRKAGVRMAYEIVEAYAYEGLSAHPASLLTLGLLRFEPTWAITCGECLATFRAKVPLIDYPVLLCPYCGTRNRLPVTVG